jgi:hypothetical protein
MKQYLHRMGFVDGVKPAYNPVAIPKTALWEARNCDVDDIGVLRIRPGSQNISTSLGTGGVQGAIEAFGGILLVWNNSLYLYTTQYTEIASNIFADGDVSMELWTENNEPAVYLHDGSGIWMCDGETCSKITPYTPLENEPDNLLRATDGTQDEESGIAKATIATLKHSLASRMAVAYENTVYLSHPWNPSYFPFDQTIQLPDDGGHITALKVAYGALIIYRDRDIWAFIGDDVTNAESVLKVQDSSIGCIDGNSIIDVPGAGQIFLGPDNFYSLQGVTAIADQYKAIPMGDDIVPYLRRAMTSKCCAVYHDREYICCFYEAKEPERVFRYKVNKGWYIDDGPRAKQYLKVNNKLYYTSPTVGQINERSLNLRTDSDKAIPFFCAFAQERLAQGPSKIKKIFVYVNSRETLQHLDVAIIGDGTEVQTVELDISAASGSDFIIGESQIGVGRIGRLSEMKVYEGKVSLDKCTFAQVRLIGTTPDEDIGVVGYSIEYRAKERMKGIKKGVVVDG